MLGLSTDTGVLQLRDEDTTELHDTHEQPSSTVWRASLKLGCFSPSVLGGGNQLHFPADERIDT